MPSFAQSLRDYHSGACTAEDLLERLDALIGEGKMNPIALLNMVNQSHSVNPFPRELHLGITSRLKRYLDQQDQDRSLQPAPAEDEHTQLATIMDDGLGPDGPASAGRPPNPDSGAESTIVLPPALAPENVPENAPKQSAGTVLNGRFVLEELVGQGGMSLVYRALDKRKLEARSRNPYVAVKVLEVNGRNESAAFMALQREAQKSQALSHPNIVRAYDFDRDGDIVFMTMEYLSGEPLSATIKALQKTGMPLPRAMKLIEQMGSALAHAHNQRIVHADFKPGNIFLTDDDTVKVIDFGIARAFKQPGDTADDKTLFDPRALGALTPAYASPEMLENIESDPRDDVYSLGCVAYELITGVHPFSRSKATDARDAGLKPRKPDVLNRRQWRVLNKALAFNRSERIATVHDLLAGLLPQPVSIASLAAAALGAIALVAGGLWLIDRNPEPPLPVVVQAPAQPQSAATQTETATVTETNTAARVPGSVFKDCATCPSLVVVPAGSVQIGSPASEPNRRAFEGPTHEVVIDQSFAIGETEITVAEFAAFAKATNFQSDAGPGCRTLENGWQPAAEFNWSSPGFAQSDQHAVTCVSYDDAQAYVAWLRQTTNARYRLPSEAEWEYAARGQVAGATLWENTSQSACAMANVADIDASQVYGDWQVVACSDGHVHTAPVLERQPNSFGLYDVQGNVFEWTQDCWVEDYKGRTTSPRAIETALCSQRILRGGSWFTAPSEQRLAFRNRAAANHRSQTYGIRVVRDL